jgi:EmrB/QacA subfamily drug resistance transporter
MDTPAGTSPDPSAQRRVLVAAILGAAIVFLDSSVATLALPAIQRDLALSTSSQQWVASAYLLTLSALLLVGGRLADVFGRRRMFLAGLAAYVVLAIAAGLSPNGTVLVAVRALQGVAGAVLVPTTLALISAAFAPHERGRAIGTWAAWSGIATLVGPLAGGLVITRLSWHFAFFITPVIAMLTIVLAWRIPESRDDTGGRSIDGLGAVLAATGLGGGVFALIEGPIAGWGSTTVWGSAAAGLVLIAVFLAYEARAQHPMLPFAMFANRALSVANAVTLFVYAGLYGMTFYISLYAQSSLGAPAWLAGTIFVPNVVLLFFLSPYAGRLNDRFGPRWLLTFGPLTAAVGIFIVSLTGPGQFVTVLLPGIFVFGIGLGFTVSPVTATAIGAAEARFSGVASGFNNMVSRVAGLIAIALMGVVVVQLWHAGVASSVSGAPAPVRAALESVRDKAFVLPAAGGLSAADAADARKRALSSAQTAFHYGVLLAALLVALGGVTAAVFLPSGPARAPAEGG